MSKYKVGDKVVMEITGVSKYGECYEVAHTSMWNTIRTERVTEPLTTYTEPLEAKIRRQAAEITRLLAENKELKEDFEKSKRVNLNMGRVAGQNEAWKLARKITCQPINGGFNRSEFEKIFGYGYISDIFEKYKYTEAAAKVAEWEKAKEEIKAGDVFEFTSGCKAVVMKVYEDGDVALFSLDGGCGIYKPHRSWHKTGRHIDVDSFLKQIRGEQE